MEDIQLLERMYTAMRKGRRLEEILAALFREGRVYGNLHLGVGEEATAVGAVAALRAEDYLFQTHRGIAGVIYRGVPLERIAAQALGKSTGGSRGRSDVVHIADRDRNVMGVSGTIGGNFGLALGAGLASVQRGDNRVTLCCFGDGAMNRGTFLESGNMMSLWTIPVVLLCDNNQFAVSARATDMFAGGSLVARAAALGMPAVTVDGNDVDAVHEAAMHAVDRARAGGGPSFIEAVTYRLRGHYEGDPQVYRTDDEHQQWVAKDPLPRTRQRLQEHGRSASDLDELDTSVEADVAAAVDTAVNAPDPQPDDIYEGILV